LRGQDDDRKRQVGSDIGVSAVITETPGPGGRARPASQHNQIW
jgi:hypothetical protein